MGVKRPKAEVKTQPNQEEKTVRQKIDYGKIMALHNAGWNNAKIADEMDMTKESVAVAICNYKKKLKERGNGQ